MLFNGSPLFSIVKCGYGKHLNSQIWPNGSNSLVEERGVQGIYIISYLKKKKKVKKLFWVLKLKVKSCQLQTLLLGGIHFLKKNQKDCSSDGTGQSIMRCFLPLLPVAGESAASALPEYQFFFFFQQKPVQKH